MTICPSLWIPDKVSSWRSLLSQQKLAETMGLHTVGKSTPLWRVVIFCTAINWYRAPPSWVACCTEATLDGHASMLKGCFSKFWLQIPCKYGKIAVLVTNKTEVERICHFSAFPSNETAIAVDCCNKVRWRTTFWGGCDMWGVVASVLSNARFLFVANIKSFWSLLIPEIIT